MTEILDPEGMVEVQRNPLAQRIDSLEGKTIGFLDNAKANADVFLEEVARIFEEEYGVAETIHRGKSTTAIPADSIAEYLHENCDAVVNAYGDCGSCTSWCVYDSIDLEQRGTPTATINSNEFVKLGQSEARSLGMAGLPIAVVEHPMGDIAEEIVHQRARDAVEEIVYVLTTDHETLEDEYEGKYLAADEELADEDLYCTI
jgi:hypothetical protein